MGIETSCLAWCLDWATGRKVQNPRIFGRSKLEAHSPVTLQNYSLALWWIKSCDIYLVCTLRFLRVLLPSCTKFLWNGLTRSCLPSNMHDLWRQASRFHHCLAATTMVLTWFSLYSLVLGRHFSIFHFLFILVAIFNLMLYFSTNAATPQSFSRLVLLCCSPNVTIYFKSSVPPVVFVSILSSFYIRCHTFVASLTTLRHIFVSLNPGHIFRLLLFGSVSS